MNRFDWRDQYDDDRDAYERALTDSIPEGPSLTQQHFAKDADINEIVRRYGISDGAIPPAAADPRYYGDFSDVPDFRQALDATRTAAERFAALPHAIRERFGNDPVRLWQFVTNEANNEEAIKLGLLKDFRIPDPKPAAPIAAVKDTTQGGVT